MTKVKVLGTQVQAELPPRALENALVAIAPLSAQIHDARGQPTEPPRRQRRDGQRRAAAAKGVKDT